VRHLCARAAPATALVQATTAAARALFLVESLGLGHFGDIAQVLRFSVVSTCPGAHRPVAAARRSRAHAHAVIDTRLKLLRSVVGRREGVRLPRRVEPLRAFAQGRGPPRRKAGVRHPSAYLSCF